MRGGHDPLPGQRARQDIDALLEAAGWQLQNFKEAKPQVPQGGVAIREYVLNPKSRADYLLFVNGLLVGAVEAKPARKTLSGVEWQSKQYAEGVPDHLDAPVLPLPFLVHTLLRLPTGVFYTQGVKANVLFFDQKPGSSEAATKKLWIYDLRTNMHFTLKTNPLHYEDLADFISCYKPGSPNRRKETDRFKPFTYDELMARDKASLDIFWLRDESLEDSANLPAPEVIAQIAATLSGGGTEEEA